jgi:integrase
VSVREGVWRVDVEVRRDPVTGRRRRVARHVHGTREDAELALARLRVADHENRRPSGGTNARTIAGAFALYGRAIDDGQVELAPSTVVTTKSACRVMSATLLADGRTFGKIPLSRVTWFEVEELYAAMRRRGVSRAYVRRCATVLSRGFELARKRGLLDTNPARDATRPRMVRTKPFSPTRAEVEAVLEAARIVDAEVADAAAVLASTGMRRGELLAVRRTDLHLDRDEVHVAAAISDGGPGIGVVRKLTKRSDWRDVPLTLSASAAFLRQLGRRESLGGPSPEDYVFGHVAKVDGPMRPDDLSDRWARARGRSKITLLHLRHFAATAMLDAGESYRTVADVLGNSESTLRLHYDGRTDVGKRKAVLALELS